MDTEATNDLHPLEAARLDAGLSREILAVKAGVTSRAIYGIEREGRKAHRATMAQLAEVLGVGVASLREDEE